MATSQHPTRRGEKRGIGWTIAALVAIVLLIWLFWGFRWPPTASVVEDDERERPGLGRSLERPAPPGGPVLPV